MWCRNIVDIILILMKIKNIQCCLLVRHIRLFILSILQLYPLTRPVKQQEGPEGPGTLTWDRRFLRVLFFHRFMYNRRHLGGLNLKAKALNVKVGQSVKFNVKVQFHKTKLYKWSKFEGLRFTSIHKNCLRFDLICLPFMTYIQTCPRHCQDKHSDQVS